MKNTFILSCESTIDLPYSYISGRDVPILHYTYTLGDEILPDEMDQSPTVMEQFYAKLDAGAMPSTSQINAFRYEEFFEELLQKGDVLHIAFGTGMTQSAVNAERAAQELRQSYPERKIVVIDSLSSSTGYGMLVDYALDMRDAGCSMDEVEKWVVEHRRCIHHQFFATDLKYFKRSGRVSGSAAAVASVLGICPLMHLNAEGRIIAYDKVRGKKRAIRSTLDVMREHALDGTAYSGKCFICHSNCIEDALEMRDAVQAQFPNISGEIRICNIGVIIASHTGSGTVALFFLGDERPQ